MQMDFLSNLTSRALHPDEPAPGALLPRLASRFEPIASPARPFVEQAGMDEQQQEQETRPATRRPTRRNLPAPDTEHLPPADSPRAANPALQNAPIAMPANQPDPLSVEQQPPTQVRLERLVVDHTQAQPTPAPAPTPGQNPAAFEPASPQPAPQITPLGPAVQPERIIITRQELQAAHPQPEPRPSNGPASREPAGRVELNTTPEQPASIHVTIGRIEVKAATSPAAPARRSTPAPAAMSLEEYLKQRQGGNR